MVRPLLTTLALLALTAALSAGLLHAQGPPEPERLPYRIDLHAGWNLISLPGDPVDGTLETLVGDSGVDMVLAYRDGQWSAAVRNSNGGWRSTSGFTTIYGGRGYWVYTTAAERIEVALSSSEEQSVPRLTPGWDLVGVRDREQRPPGTEIDADDYFYDSWWRVAYGYLTAENRWTRQIPNHDGTVQTGAGYWVWGNRPSCLCP